MKKMELEKKLDNLFSQFEALEEIKRIFPYATYIPPTRGWAASPDFLLKLIELIFLYKPKNVIELGSGVSTIIIGLALNKISEAKLVSLDHEEEYAIKTNGLIELNGLGRKIKVNYSPLNSYKIEDSNWLWYDTNSIKSQANIDFIIVDGPPRKLQEKSRFPALPILFEKLSRESTIILDDSNRDNEIEVIESWQKFLDNKRVTYSITLYPEFDKGAAIFRIKKH